MRNALLSAALLTTLSCASVPAPPAATPLITSDPSITALAIARDRSTLWYSVGLERCEVRALSIEARTARVAFRLDACPSSIIVLEDESLVLTDGTRFGAWKRPDGSDVIARAGILAAADTSNYVTSRSGRIIWKRGEVEADVGARESIRRVRILPVAGDLVMVRRVSEGERVVRVTASGENEVTPAYSVIDSIDVAPRGEEIVLSAQRERGFDVAIASTDGKTVNWIAPDPADEVGVTWAPRGNKVSYLMRGIDSTLVRTVHIPTAFQLTFDTPFTTVRQLAWEPRAERIAMSLASPIASPCVDWIEYAGTGRTTLVAPRDVIAREPERVTLGSAPALLLPPATVRYGAKLPLLVRITNEPMTWSSELRDLDSIGGGILLAPADSWRNGDPLAALIQELRWVDPEQVIVVDPTATLVAATSWLTRGSTLVTLGTKQPRGRFFRESHLPEGGTIVATDRWSGVMEYLRVRFKATR